MTLPYALLVRGAAAALVLVSPPSLAAPRSACSSALRNALPAPIMTHGTVTARTGGTIAYTAEAGLLRVEGGLPSAKTAGRVPMVGQATPPTATMSYYAFTADKPSGRSRPLLFIWDGGPGASTRPMLLNSFGPVVLNTGNGPAGASQRTPTRSNPDTLLDAADLVFVDAPGTGFGQLEGCDPARGFYGIDVDAAAFQRFIQQFIRAYHRERSPVFLMGESYGTARAAVVARRLQDAGTPVSGVILMSQILAFDAVSDGAKANVGTENAFFLTLPTFAATAWVHDKVPHKGGLEPWLHEVERFSLQTYAPALLQGDNLAADQRRALAEQLASYTGLPAKTWLNENLRIEGSRFRDLLEADEGRIVGREDTRTDGPVPKVRGTAVEDDPTPPFLAKLNKDAFVTYVRGTLRLGDRPFAPYIEGSDTQWDMHHVTDPSAWAGTYVNVAPDLVAAMNANPAMRVSIVAGYFDLSTPYLGASYLVSHLPVTDEARHRIEWKNYPAPHNVFGVDEVRRDMHDRFARFIEQ